MIDRQALLSDLQNVLKALEADLLERSESANVPEVEARLREEYGRAQKAERTAQSYEEWRGDYVTQMAAAWVLSCVFVRFLEDNRLVDPPRIAGPNERLGRARDEHTLFFQDPQRARLTDREYLLAVFDALAALAATRDVFGEHNPVRELPNWLSGDAAGELLKFLQRIDANTGKLVHDFTDPAWDTRFLGDLYQDLSGAARKRYALLQTPEFVEEFILDYTLDPALDEFGLDAPPVLDRDGQPVTGPGFRMIDPACGSGHFLLGAFRRVLERWQRAEPGAKAGEQVQRALDSVYGVDVNPYAVAIARFRLLLAAMRACGVTRLADAPAFRTHIHCGDSLLHASGEQMSLGWRDYDHAYHGEDREALRQVLRSGGYHAVVANPPYITPKDRALNQAYRERYPSSCHMKYSLAVPFLERIFRLAVPGGYTGQITANSFMKREFGKKLIENFLKSVDLTHIVDTSGAYIPGHGTPTVILFGRNCPPVAGTIRTVMGIRGEPSTPDDPSRGLVWTAITKQIRHPSSESEFVSIADSPRETFQKHPWSIGGGGAAELKEQLDEAGEILLSRVVEEIGVFGITAADDVMSAPDDAFRRFAVERASHVRLILGDEVRDWSAASGDHVLFPYVDEELIDLNPDTGHYRWLWPNRTTLWDRATFSRRTYRDEGRTWWEWHQTTLHRLRTPLSIVYAEVATHNHFVLDRGGKVFKQTAPVVKLPREASEDDHLALLGLLNSSTACFWLKQVCHQKQMMGGDGIRIESKAKVPYAFNATALGKLPIPSGWETGPLRDALVGVTRRLATASQQYSALGAASVLTDGGMTAQAIRERWDQALQQRQALRSEQIWFQEEIDFIVYRMFGLCSDELLSGIDECPRADLSEGGRPFCIVAGGNEDGFPVPSDLPEDWRDDLKRRWAQRIEAIRKSPELRLLESSMYKRRWIGRQGLFNHQRSDDELGDAAKSWLLDRLESYFDFDGRMNDEGQPTADDALSLIGGGRVADGVLSSVAKLADVAGQDEAFREVAALYRDDPAFDVQKLVGELVAAESVPLLPVLRYKPSGLRKRAEWEKTWELQRREDAIDARTRLPKDDPDHLTQSEADDLKRREVGEIPVPPKYTSADFLSTGGARYWALRGKLDVPKERWVSFPHCEGRDGTPVIAWAGHDHLQLARAVSAHYVEIQEHLGGRDDPRLAPLLGCLIELLPWLKQWHNETDPQFGVPMGDYFEGFIAEEARGLGLTLAEIKAWQPPKKARGRKKSGTA